MARYGTTPHRQKLLAGLYDGLVLLRAAGCRTVYIDGSFVTVKPNPGDFDACWDPTGVQGAALDPVFLDLCWPRTAQKARFSGEFFFANAPADPLGTLFLDFFKRARDGTPKGIVALDLGGLP